MKSFNLKRASISAVMVWGMGVTSFLTSYYVPLMDDPDTQANWVLSIALIPAVMLGAHFYYMKEQEPNGFILGLSMFGLTIILDACITVPIFMLPTGIDHLAFFGDPGFWMIGLEYILVVVFYRKIRPFRNETKQSQVL